MDGPSPPPARFGPRRQGNPRAMTNIQATVPYIDLPHGERIPQLGFGVFQIPPAETEEAVLYAFDTGYRHIDTAAAYENEAEVGQAFRASGLLREDVFITTKCPNDSHGYDQATRAFKNSLERLEMTHVDLYLIDWPVPAQDRYVETWRALIDLQEQEFVRSIGVSNFQPHHLDRIIGGNRGDACGQPDRASPALSAARPAPRARRAAGSSPRPGARSPRARCSSWCSGRSPRPMAAPSDRRCCAGTSSPGT